MHADEEILDVALGLFATHGYEAMSVRSLNRELGLAHGTVNQRFHSKNALYLAAIDQAFAQLTGFMAEELGNVPESASDLEKFRTQLTASVRAMAHQPKLPQVMFAETIVGGERLDYIFATWLHPAHEVSKKLVDRLTASGVIRPINGRDLFFLMTYAALPLGLEALSKCFDDQDGPFDLEAHVEHSVDIIMRGLIT